MKPLKGILKPPKVSSGDEGLFKPVVPGKISPLSRIFIVYRRWKKAFTEVSKPLKGILKPPKVSADDEELFKPVVPGKSVFIHR